jgi:hypothetical protein
MFRYVEEKNWAAWLDEAKIWWTTKQEPLAVESAGGVEYLDYSFLLVADDTYLVVQEEGDYGLPTHIPVGDLERAGHRVLVGKYDGTFAFWSCPDEPESDVSYLFFCRDCQQGYFSASVKSACARCHAGASQIQSIGKMPISAEEVKALAGPQTAARSSVLFDGGLADKAGHRESSNWAQLRSDLSGIPRVHHWPKREALEDLGRRYPNFQPVVDLLLQETLLAGSRKDPALRLPRILLVGGPSCGKSSFADALADLLVGSDREHLDFGHQIPSFALVGSDSQFRAAKVGRVLRLMAGAVGQGPVKNPMMILDELDKISPHYQYDPLPALLSLLDERESRSYIDEYFTVPVDVSGMIILALANDSRQMPAPLKSRFMEFYVRDYSLEELVDVVVPAVYSKWVSEFWEGSFPDELSYLTRRRVVELAEGVPRQVRAAISSLATTGYRELCRRPTFESLKKEAER